MHLYYDRQGQPVTGERWAELIEDDSYRQIALTDVGNCRISTIWFGLLGYEKVPVIFETDVYGPDLVRLDRHRWATEAEALRGHAAAVKEVESRKAR